MTEKSKKGIDYNDEKVRKEVLDRQRREMWTPEQIGSFAKHFRLKPGMKLLDAGCGYGYSLRKYGPYCLPGGILAGLDLEKQLLLKAREKAEEEGLAGSSRFYQGDIFNMPFHPDSFDITICQVVMCHITEQEKALDELIRVTRPGGCIAVLDNAAGMGFSSGWSSTYKPTIPKLLFMFEAAMRQKRARKKSGLGDYSVCCYMPSWMEKRGLLDVNVRNNEKVFWIAPPYNSPAQQTELQKTRERMLESRRISSTMMKRYRKQMLLGGADEKMINRTIRSARRSRKERRKALDEGTLAFSHSYNFWCVWGFKP